MVCKCIKQEAGSTADLGGIGVVDAAERAAQ